MATSPYSAALESLRRIQRGLSVAASSEERQYLLELHEQTLQLLESSTKQRRLSTRALAARVGEIESKLSDRSPAERGAIARERLGISKSRYYEIRKFLHESG